MSDYRGSGASMDDELDEGLIGLELKGATVGEERASVGMAGAGRQWNTLLRTPSNHSPGHTSTHESLDYDQIHSQFDRERDKEFTKRKFYGYSGASVGRWVLTAACGLLIGLTAFGMSKAIESIMSWKMQQLTARIKVDLMQRTGDVETTALSDGSGGHAESINDALNFDATQACHDIQAKAVCGDLHTGNPNCFWDNSHEDAMGRCEDGVTCCVQKAGSPLIFFFFVNTTLALLACLPVVLFSKEAAGSGIPEVMGYLNGVHIRKLLKLRTLIAKVWGTIMIVASGAAVGPEGPLVHSGAIIGSGLTRGHKTCGKKTIEHKLSLFTLFHNDTDRRDFISMGAAAGFAAAFGAPVGGVLFALEEASSFWNAKLMWRLLLCTSLACFTLSFCRNLEDILAADDHVRHEAGARNFKFEPGMLTLNTKDSLNLSHQWELLLCCVLGCLCGVLGAVFNKLVALSQKFRPKPADAIADDDQRTVAESCCEVGKLLRQHLFRILEVVFISMLTSAATYGLPYMGAWIGFACQIQPTNGTDARATYAYETFPFYCPDAPDGQKQYNDMATILLSSRENSILSLVEHPHAFASYSLITISVSFFTLMIVSFGMAVPAGIFMPTIVVGCTFGALFGRSAKYLSCLMDYNGPNSCMQNAPFDPSNVYPDHGIRLNDPDFEHNGFLDSTVMHAGPYALLGAVGLLGGIQRSSVSLVVIIVEGTGKVDYLLPIIFTTVCAKWVGDHLNDGIYHTALHVKGIPFLENEPARGLRNKSAQDLMHEEPVCVDAHAKVRDVRDLLQTEGMKCNGFPVVKEVSVGNTHVKVYQGVILLQNLGVLLRRKRWYARNEQEGTLERVKSRGVSFVSGTSSAASVDRTKSAASTGYNAVDQMENGGGAAAGGGATAMEDGLAMEMSSMASPATRGTINDMQSAKHRSNHNDLVDEALQELTEDDLDMYVNIAEAMNCAPYHVLSDTPAFKVHRLFRTMGLRHLVVVSELNEVKGMITRADLISGQHRSTNDSDGHSLH